MNPKVTLKQNHLFISSQDGVIFSGEVDKVTFPGKLGSLQILRSHAPLTTILEKGRLSYSPKNSKSITIEIEEGVGYVKNNNINALITLVKKSDEEEIKINK